MSRLTITNPSKCSVKRTLLFLGKGSNVLFTEHFDGLVIVNRIMGKHVTETDDQYLLHIAGGEDTIFSSSNEDVS